ncbi:5-bromo-4-chloroindolyl phosphate hydrolysis family protein [Parvibacter caecicola]|uniref:5-bromo-4-chloroindolyl phosphate hydrolysis family protein n=1 Tax=Parvibacter caecicola TaxID=747645 RepID=UPI0023F220B9|nr:5-bromo-4-chloroindolyl phosphate hydrolysis family protein [Parvibacter caecicola]
MTSPANGTNGNQQQESGTYEVPPFAPEQPKGSPAGSMTPEEFEQLCRSIGDTVGKGLAAGGSALGSAIGQAVGSYQQHSAKKAEKMRQALAHQQELAAQQQAAAAEKRAKAARTRAINARFTPVKGKSNAGVWMSALGGIFTVSFANVAMEELMSVIAVQSPEYFFDYLLPPLIALGLSIWLLAAGINRLRAGSALKSIKRITGSREVVTIQELSAQMQKSPAKLTALCRKLIKNGSLPQGHLDDNATCLMVTDNAYHYYRQAQADEAQRRKKSLEEEQTRPSSRKTGEPSRLTDAQKTFLKEGEHYVQQMKDLDAAIDDEEVSRKIVAIEELVSRILARAAEEPSLIDGMTRFTNIYLPTTIKLLTAYDALEEQPVQGSNIASSRQEIEQTLDVLQAAYEKQLDEMFQDMSMDVSSDISVLKAMLAQEGLTESPLKPTDK